MVSVWVRILPMGAREAVNRRNNVTRNGIL